MLFSLSTIAKKSVLMTVFVTLGGTGRIAAQLTLGAGFSGGTEVKYRTSPRTSGGGAFARGYLFKRQYISGHLLGP